jgi:uncharacterized LabA/DUF88 family protein
MATRVAIFVDGANMFYAQRENGWHIEYRRVLEYFTDNREKAGAFYFTATPAVTNLEALQKYRKFRSALTNVGYTVIDKEVKVIRDYKTGITKLKGNLDIELVFRIMTQIGHYDEAVILGGDSDLVPIIEHIGNLGKRIVCVGRRATTAHELINVVHKFIDLNEIRERIEKSYQKKKEP